LGVEGEECVGQRGRTAWLFKRRRPDTRVFFVCISRYAAMFRWESIIFTSSINRL
jgi:hypothetical protein